MLFKIKEKCHPTVFLMMIGFSISFTSVLIGISSVDMVLTSLEMMDAESTPIYSVMENTGMTLALEIYLFSIANCLVITNYWIITKRREMAIRKAFGWTNKQLMGLVLKEIGSILVISMLVCTVLLFVVYNSDMPYISVHLSPFFIISTVVLLVFTLGVASLIPIIKIMKICPAEVIS